MKQLQVEALSHSYPIYINDSFQSLLDNYLKLYTPKKVAILTNTTIQNWYLEPLQKNLDNLGVEHISIILDDGEQYKTLESISKVYDALMENRFERKSLLIALGGGVIGDMAGFAAATYQRGMPFLQIPTTLLSQVDSSVGGKTGVNHPLGKNMIGAFYQPQAVFIGTDVLKTLPQRELSAGLAEVIKYALLGNREFYDYLMENMDDLLNLNMEKLIEVISICCQMKADIVKEDEKEEGKRALLNLGHTFAHAIETEAGYGNWLHGEAVGAGMVLAARVSKLLGYLSDKDVEDITTKLIERAKLPIVPPKMSFERWYSLMSHDKKVQDSKIRFILLKSIGSAFIDGDVPQSVLQEALAPYL